MAFSEIDTVVHEEEQLRELAGEHGQGHLFRFWDELSADERSSLLAQVADIDFDLVDRLVRDNLAGSEEGHGEVELAPAPIIGSGEDSSKAAEIGDAALRAGKVAAMVVAGGQGSRLGFDGPKGAFEIGPVSNRSLFQYHAEKIAAYSQRFGVTVPWYVMTSRANNAATVSFFEENKFFGLHRDDVTFFEQG
ncbi:MAG: UTP--glucose-1-phosphate uridylyltransferase, partial [Planctomycetota bacterium]